MKENPEQNLTDSESDLLSNESSTSAENENIESQLVNEMTLHELQQYETFRRSNFPKSLIKKFISNVIGQALNPNLVIAVGGLAKVYVGEMVEKAKEIQKNNGEDGPLLPSHIHEAHRQMYGRMPNTEVFKNPPWYF